MRPSNTLTGAAICCLRNTVSSQQHTLAFYLLPFQVAHHLPRFWGALAEGVSPYTSDLQLQFQGFSTQNPGASTPGSIFCPWLPLIGCSLRHAVPSFFPNSLTSWHLSWLQPRLTRCHRTPTSYFCLILYSHSLSLSGTDLTPEKKGNRVFCVQSNKTQKTDSRLLCCVKWMLPSQKRNEEQELNLPGVQRALDRKLTFIWVTSFIPNSHIERLLRNPSSKTK